MNIPLLPGSGSALGRHSKTAAARDLPEGPLGGTPAKTRPP